MKTWVIFAVLFFGCINLARPQIVGNGSQQQQPAQSKPDPTQPASQTRIPLPQVQTSPPEKKQQTEQKPYQYQWRELYAPANVPNWALALLAGWAGVMALKTLRAINRQADMFASKERARLTVELEPFEFGKSTEASHVNLIVTNHGSTNAFIGSAKCLVCIRDRSWDTKNELLSQMGIPKAISPEPEGVKLIEFVTTGEILIGRITDQIHESLRIRQSKMYVIGYIDFSDVFDNKWRLRFCKAWGGDHSVGQWWFAHEWPDYGPPEANGEYKVKKAKRRWFSRDAPN